MTTWTKNQATAALRQCVLNVAAIADGAWAPPTTDLTGKVFIRLGDESFIAASGTVTNMRRPLVQADNTFTVDAGTDVVTLSAADPATGSGPFLASSSGSLPGGIDPPYLVYWIRTGTSTGKFATSVANALAGTEIDITSAGTGTHTLADTADTEQPIDGKWIYQGTQTEANSTTNEVEVAVIDSTYYAQTLVRIATLSEIADEVWDAVLESPHTAGDLMRLLASFAAGKVQNFSTGTLAFRNLADTVTRFTIVRSALGRITSTISNLLP